MVTSQACRLLSRDMLLALGWRARRQVSQLGVLLPDGPRCTVDKQMRQLIVELGCTRITRGQRAGLHLQAKRSRHLLMNEVTSSVVRAAHYGEIPTVIGNRLVDKQSVRRPEYKGLCGSSDCRRSVLSVVPKAEILSPSFKVGVFNAQSVANKSASVCHWIAHNDLHIAAVVETWLDGSDSPSLVACSPPSFRYVERARPLPGDLHSLKTNHGSVCLFYKGNMHVRPITLPTYDTFEYLSVYVRGSGMHSLVIVLYRSATITDKFFDSFTDLLERTVPYKSVVIAGDIIIHLDILTDHHTIKFNHILTVFGLTQHVQSPTHRCGHLLDVLITRSDVTTRSVHVDQPMSDSPITQRSQPRSIYLFVSVLIGSVGSDAAGVPSTSKISFRTSKYHL
jgi:hypothetical protein